MTLRRAFKGKENSCESAVSWEGNRNRWPPPREGARAGMCIYLLYIYMCRHFQYIYICTQVFLEKKAAAQSLYEWHRGSYLILSLYIYTEIISQEGISIYFQYILIYVYICIAFIYIYICMFKSTPYLLCFYKYMHRPCPPPPLKKS